jgi:DNA-binding NarL/FixJ family response regulator
MASPFVVTLAAADWQILEATARSGRAEHRQARIVLAAADGQSNAGIARELRIVVDTVRKWRTRFCQQGGRGQVANRRERCQRDGV